MGHKNKRNITSIVVLYDMISKVFANVDTGRGLEKYKEHRAQVESCLNDDSNDDQKSIAFNPWQFDCVLETGL